jgi:hypothetical protein
MSYHASVLAHSYLIKYERVSTLDMKLKTNKKAVLLYSNKRPAFLIMQISKDY